ncbi:MAG: TIGR03936 family radical SAM-associated protein [Elusimicrobia bacterium]|nr:TIGR03936 family radical SAM-associated protein [Elusimicrobiota bacterium]
MNDNGPRVRIRLKFARLAAARNLSHLEQIKALRNLVIASGLRYSPVKCGRGRAPRMAFGPAISVGYESRCEYADLYLAEFAGDEEVRQKIKAVSSECYELIAAKRVPIFFPSIEASVNAAEYIIKAGFPAGFSQKEVDSFLARPDAFYEKVKPSGARETIDVKPLVLCAQYDPAAAALAAPFPGDLPQGTPHGGFPCVRGPEAFDTAPAHVLKLVLKFEPKKNVKPEIVLNMIARADINRIVRKELYWFDSKGRLEVF